MRDQRPGEQRSGRVTPLQVTIGIVMGIALAVIIGLGLGSWTYAFIGFAAGFLIYSPIAFRQR